MVEFFGLGLFGCFAGDSVLLPSYGLACGGIALFGFGGLWVVMIYWFGFLLVSCLGWVGWCLRMVIAIDC